MMGPRAALRARRQRQLLAEAIDRDFYIGQMEVDPGSAFDPVAHYLAEGWRAAIEPAPGFDSEHYAWAYPDVAGGGLPPFLHYLEHGKAEARDAEASYNGYEDVRPWFDAAFYAARNPELVARGVDLFDHFAYTGWREGRDPNAWFSVAAWRAANSDAPPDINPLALHMREGLRFGRALAPGEPIWRRPSWAKRRAVAASSGLIDERYYFSHYPEVAAAGLSAVDHYLIAGAAELRNPGPAFDTGWWAAQRGVTPREALFDFLNERERAADLSGRPPLTAVFRAANRPPPARLAVHLHLRHLHLAEWLIGGLARWPDDAEIWASVANAADAAWLRRRLTALRPATVCEVRVDPRLDAGVLPEAFTDRAGTIDAILCLHSEPPLGGGRADDARRGVLFDALLAVPSAGAQAAAAFAATPTLSWLYPEADFLLRQTWPAFAAGLPQAVGWLNPRALRRLSAQDGSEAPVAPVFDPDLSAAAVELLLAERLAARLEEDGQTAPFLWPDRQRAEIGPPPPAPSGMRPTGRRWPRESPAVLLNGVRALAPRSTVFDPARLDIAWIMPDLLKGSGGHMTILRLVEQLARFGHRQTIWVQNPRHPDPQPIKQRMQQWFRPIPDDVAVVALPDDMRAISADAVIATEAWSAFPAASVTNAKARFYLIQDYEPLFHPAGETAILARQTYDLGLDALTAGDWLLGKAQDHGMWARKWDLAVDHAVYFPAPKDVAPVGSAPPRIAVYARRSTPRRAVGLAIAALTELHRRGVVFEAALFGDDDPSADLAFPHVNLGIAEPETLGALYRESDVGLVFSATNYSLVPLEMMACGLPVVELDGESTRTVFRYDEAVLAAPTAGAVADALQRLIEQPMAHKLQAGRGLAFVRDLSWGTSARAVEAAILERLHERARPIDPAAICAPFIGKVRRASVVIPTYNGGRLFDRVLAAAASQDCDFEYDVLVIDSGSSDRTAEVASKVGGRVWLHNIDQTQFQHGRTRNLGVELTDGEVVAFLTQDALPGDRQWLARLVEGFGASDRVGAVFGRHRAYPAHGLYAARDLDGWFDQFATLGPLFSTRLGLPSFIHAGGEDWRRLMGFHSDNNSALLRAAWAAIPYPEIDWGEDQVLGWELLRQGFDKAYADEAVVFHSHQRKAGDQLQTAIEEGKLFKAQFGMDLVDEATASGLIDALTAADSAFAAQRDLSPGVLAMRLESQRLAIEGRLRGAALAGD